MAQKVFSVCQWDIKKDTSSSVSSEYALTSVSETVFDPDHRELVAATDYAQGGKYRAILKLHMRYKKQKTNDTRWAAGSGWLIASDLLVTAGHCVYDHGAGYGPATRIKAYLGYYGKASLGQNGVQVRYGQVIATPSSWVNARARINDFALVKLDKAFDDVTPIPFLPTPAKGDAKLGVVGFPADKRDDNGERGAYMYSDLEQVSFNLSEHDGLLTYEISTYAGQSGSPVLQFDDKDNVVGSIATHVAGGGEKNFASPIASDANNPYTAVRNYFFGKNVVPEPSETCNGINYHNVPVPSSEAYVNPTTAAWHTSKRINRGIPDDVLTDGQLFRGVVGSASSILAGTALGYAGKLSLSVINNNGSLPSVLPSHTGYSERALIADSALQYLLVNEKLPKEQRLSKDIKKGIFAGMHTRYKANYPFLLAAAPHLVDNVQDCAMRVALDHIRRSDDDSLSTHTPSDEKESLPPSSESSQEGGDDVDANAAAFRARLLGPAYKLQGDEGFFDVLGDVINMGMNLPGTLVKLAPVALNLLNNVIRQESETDDDENDNGVYGEEQKAHRLELTDLAARALLAETALCALIDADQTVLEEKGFFEFVKEAMQKVGGAVLANAPRMIDAAVPVVKSLLQAESLQGSNSGQDSDSTDDDDDELFDQTVSEKQSIVASESRQQSGKLKFGSGDKSAKRRSNKHPRPLTYESSARTRDRFLASTPYLQRSKEKMVAVASDASTPDDDLFREVGQGDIGHEDIYWSEQEK